jgi:hypothetical protein
MYNNSVARGSRAVFASRDTLVLATFADITIGSGAESCNVAQPVARLLVTDMRVRQIDCRDCTAVTGATRSTMLLFRAPCTKAVRTD